jgi:Amt family ammonium transporter
VRDALKLDDPTDLISVHAAGGAIGTILTGIFATKRIGTGEGWIDGNFNQVILQIAAVVVVVAWCIVVTYILISVLEAIFSRTKRRSQLLTAAPKI